MHKEIIKSMAVSRAEYLAKLRMSQPMPELERKAKKARRRSLWTCEEIDFALARGAKFSAEIETLFEQGGAS